jgi:hypothetical protein
MLRRITQQVTLQGITQVAITQNSHFITLLGAVLITATTIMTIIHIIM